LFILKPSIKLHKIKIMSSKTVQISGEGQLIWCVHGRGGGKKGYER
jgi:hypothetical protein